MSYIGKNIKKIRTVKKLSQAKFAELFNLARPSVGAYEEGRSEPKIDTVIQISEHFQLSIDALLTKEITVNELYHFDIFNTEEQTVQLHPASSQLQTPYVSLKDQTAYCQQGHDKAYRDKLPSLQFPKGKSTHRIFEVPETSLLNIEKGDLLAGKTATLEKMRSGELYIIVGQSVQF
ncbi:MAG: helix-turn-helix domain-containing protein [Cytophagales bacterium]|nr:helix-turn-helix domain-containing protein [Cytophagales bacterium]